MSRRSSIEDRRRRRNRRKLEQRKKPALQLPVFRKVRTADLFAEIERRATALAEIFEGQS
jgi:hypothetical protein